MDLSRWPDEPAGPASGRGLAGPRQPVRSLDMTAHRYDMAELGGDYARGAAGVALTALPLILLPMHWIVAVAFGAAALVFLAFLLRTWLRHRSVIEVDGQGIVAHGP